MYDNMDTYVSTESSDVETATEPGPFPRVVLLGAPCRLKYWCRTMMQN